VRAARGVPGSFHPYFRYGMQAMTMSWLRRGVASGRVPRLRAVPADAEANATVLLAISVSVFPYRVHPGECQPMTVPVARRLEAGGTIGFRGSVLVTARLPGGPESVDLAYVQNDPHRIVTHAGPLVVTLRPQPGASAEICNP
jgi:hypothetical protein